MAIEVRFPRGIMPWQPLTAYIRFPTSSFGLTGGKQRGSPGWLLVQEVKTRLRQIQLEDGVDFAVKNANRCSANFVVVFVVYYAAVVVIIDVVVIVVAVVSSS